MCREAVVDVSQPGACADERLPCETATLFSRARSTTTPFATVE
jgi:hypothetical protein